MTSALRLPDKVRVEDMEHPRLLDGGVWVYRPSRKIPCIGSWFVPEERIFKVTFKPKASWADQTYFGNMLMEVLGAMAKTTGAFDFDVQVMQG